MKKTKGKKLTRAQKIYMTRKIGLPMELVKYLLVVRETPELLEIRDRSSGIIYVIEKAEI